MGPVILARGLEGRAPYAVKIHGSALEYTVRPHRERFLPYAREGIVGASGSCEPPSLAIQPVNEAPLGAIDISSP
jgi:hypothetical protein